VLDRAARYIGKLPDSIEGQNGSDVCFNAACCLVLGFDLTPNEAFPILEGWNKTHAKPPWSERELRHKLDDADKKPDERGYLLNEPPPRRARAPKREKPQTAGEHKLTDLGNAQRLVERHGQSMRFCHPWGKWLVYDGKR
jgi:hypothetical protein